MATSNLGYQSFYQAQLTSNIDDTELIIPLDTAPIPDEGFLVIESTVASKREIIYYTSKTSNSVTCPAGAGLGRGYDGTTAVSHLSGSAVIMAPVAAMFESLTDLFTTTPQGWTNQTPAISTVVANGNRSYTLTHASSIASVVSPGMRRRFTRQTAANTYMGGAFNGSSHYFTKTTPSGTLGTVTNNFTIEAVMSPTSYAAGYACGRVDGTVANGFAFGQTASGQVEFLIRNAGVGNSRSVVTYQSLPLNKKTHVSASMTGATILIYFDGVAVPTATTTAGTAPTTAGTGGDFSIGRAGAYAGLYFPGYISNVAVFDAVLSQATIRQHATYKLTGSETNCIGAWSLDNTANDQSSAGNNLTATGGVGFTNKSPFGNDGVTDNLEYGLTMSVSSDGLTEVVQCPEGCALPTTGGITASAYSSMANPYGWVSDKGRWEVATLHLAAVSQASPASSTYYLGSSFNLIVPVGSFEINLQAACNWWRVSAGEIGGNAALSTSTSAVTNRKLMAFGYTDPGNQTLHLPVNLSDGIRNTTQTTYYAIINAFNGTHASIAFGSNYSSSSITAIPSGL